MFLEISEEERPSVQLCLRWIDFHNELYGENIPLPILLQAIGVRDDGSSKADAMDYIDEVYLPETCGCLTNISAGTEFHNITLDSVHNCQVVSFAHYTVREYLISNRIPDSVATDFKLKDQLQPEPLRIIISNALRFELAYWNTQQPSNTRCIEILSSHFPSYCAISSMFSVCTHYTRSLLIRI